MSIIPNENTYEAPHTLESFIGAFYDAIQRTMFRVILGKLWIFAPKAIYFKNCKISHKFIDYYVNEALGQKDCSVTAVNHDLRRAQKQSMIRSLSEQTGDRLHIRSQILQSMLVLRETISILLRNTFLFLSRHPSCWEQICNEAKNAGAELYKFDSLHDCKPIQNILCECE